MIFFTADCHFSHANIIKYENRPFASTEEMEEVMCERWNSKVNPNDEVYILGDFIFGTGLEANRILRKLNGKKYLIKGNHDRFLKDKNFDSSLFVWVKDYHVLKHDNQIYVLFHFPIQTWDRKHYGSIHLYGHVHSNISDHSLEVEISRSFNVGVDVNDFTPVSIVDINLKTEERLNDN